MFDEFKEVMTLEFKMSNIGLMLYHISIESKQTGKSIFISQEGYAKIILKKFDINMCYPMTHQ